MTSTVVTYIKLHSLENAVMNSVVTRDSLENTVTKSIVTREWV